jgi:copper/silver efflux system protein
MADMGGGGMAGAGPAASQSSMPAVTMGGGAGASAEGWLDRWGQQQAAVPLGMLAGISVVAGPPMIKSENGMLVGYVFADIDGSQRDLGGWVNDARELVDSAGSLPQGYRLEWTGQYEFMAATQERLKFMVPLTLVLIVFLLFMALQGWGQTFLVLLSAPFAIVGSVLLLAALNYNLSTAVWVGLIAVAGVATQTAIVVVVYLDQSLREAAGVGKLTDPESLLAAVVEGAVRGVRPMVMTVATTVLGLLPLLWESGVGADLSARTAAPVVGGMVACLFLSLLVIPAAYTIWRQGQLRAGNLRF